MRDKVWGLLRSDTQAKIKQLIADDLKELVSTLGYEMIAKGQIQNVDPPEPKKKRGGKRERVVIPKVFDRQFKSVAKMAEYFNVTPAKIYYWLKEGHDLEDKLTLPKSDVVRRRNNTLYEVKK